jgi:glycosyltransferase involved in cell wall biosynthesis
MNLLDLLVLLSRTTRRWKEQFGRVLVEARASGVIVVGSDLGEIPRVIGDGGLMFPEGDVPALLDALRRGVAMGGGARERALRLFANERIVAGTVDVYREIASSPREGGK